jgi:hypothetical protein
MTAEAMSQGLTPAVTSAERSGGAEAVTAMRGGRLLGPGDAIWLSRMLQFDALVNLIRHSKDIEEWG